MYYVYYALLQMGFVHLTLPSMPAYVGTLNTESINIDSRGTTPSSWRISCYPGRSVSNGTQRWTAEKAAGQKANKLFIFANKKTRAKSIEICYQYDIFFLQKAYNEIQRVPPGGQLQITHNPPAKPKRSSVEHRSKKKYVRYLYQQYTKFI